MKFALFRRVPADPAHLRVRHAGQSFQVALRRRPTAKRITLRVSNATGEVVLTIPERTELSTAQRFAESHGDWIATRLARVPERIAFDRGAVIPFRGVPHRVVHWTSMRGTTQATKSPSGEAIIAVSGDAPHVGRRVREFLEAEARARSRRSRETPHECTRRGRQAHHRPRHQEPLGLVFREGALNFSWRLIIAPPFVLDYLAAHEVAHLRELNHSHRFWKITHDLCPRTDEAESWLKLHGSELHRFG